MFEDLSSLPGWIVPVAAGYGAYFVGIAAYDVWRQRIPNVAVYPAILVALGLAFVRPDGHPASFIVAGLGAGGFFVLLDTLSRGSMGMGDAKLALCIGLLTGWPGVAVALFVAFAAGASMGLGLIALGRLERRAPMPFAPALAVGAFVAAVAGQRVADLLWAGVL